MEFYMGHCPPPHTHTHMYPSQGIPNIHPWYTLDVPSDRDLLVVTEHTTPLTVTNKLHLLMSPFSKVMMMRMCCLTSIKWVLLHVLRVRTCCDLLSEDLQDPFLPTPVFLHLIQAHVRNQNTHLMWRNTLLAPTIAYIFTGLFFNIIVIQHST